MTPAEIAGLAERCERMIARSAEIMRAAIDQFAPTHIVSMVSGGKDSACSDAVLAELGFRVDLVIHGYTRCGIPETTRFVETTYGAPGRPPLAIADAGTAYEDYVLRKGFFGVGIAAHGFSYRILKADPFRSVVSRELRKRRRSVVVMLVNGARKDESENRQKHLQLWRQDPSRPNNVWVNIIHDWTQADRDRYLESRGVPINPVAAQLCRSGECMCGTTQTKAERAEAAAIYPEWGAQLDALEAEARRLHGFGWGEAFPRRREPGLFDQFQPMCVGCNRRALAARDGGA